MEKPVKKKFAIGLFVALSVNPAPSFANGGAAVVGIIMGTATRGNNHNNSSAPDTTSPLSGIPFRCRYELTKSDEDYRACRWPSLRAEILDAGKGRCVMDKYGMVKAEEHFSERDCDVNAAMESETKALHAYIESFKTSE
jgi:hypothetical protein